MSTATPTKSEAITAFTDRADGLVSGFAVGANGVAPIPTLEAAEAWLERGDGWVWLHLSLAAQPATRWLARSPFIPDEARSELTRLDSRAHFELANGAIYGHLRDWRMSPDDGRFTPGTVAFVVTDRLAITVRRYPVRAIDVLRREAEAGHLPARPVLFLGHFLRTFNMLVEQYQEHLMRDLAAIEQRVLERRGEHERQKLMRMHRAASSLTRDMAFKRAALAEMMHKPPDFVASADWQDLKAEIRRYGALVADMSECREQLLYLVEELRTQLNERTNRNLYVLTLMSSIFVPLSFLTGLWGMNVGDLPFEGGEHGFWIVLSVMVFMAGLILFCLHRLRLIGGPRR